MQGFLWNVSLALVWVTVTGQFQAGNLFLGFVLGFLVLLLMQKAMGAPAYTHRVSQVLGLAGFIFWELILSNLRVAKDVLRPHRIRPGVVAVPLDVSTDEQITLLANLITVTPGTVCLDVSSDRRTLYIHVLYLDDIETFRQHVKHGYERRVLELLD